MAFDATETDYIGDALAQAEEEEALRVARERAVAELERLREEAAKASVNSLYLENYSQHTVEGLGIYVIPRRTGWKSLLDIIHDPVPNIDFSANIYPAFDGIIGQYFQSPYLLDPLDDKYESYESLRDNLAAVRNFLMQHYFANPPAGMTTEKAKTAMAQIATFIGEGLDNNFLYYGVLPNHKFGEPHIDLTRAREKGGAGAQYIYECVLAMQRRSDWARPFDAVRALFGGKAMPDWQLPGADQTHFTDFFSKDIVGKATVQSAAVVAASVAIDKIDARLNTIRDKRALGQAAGDLDMMGEQLLMTAGIPQGVAQLDEPLRVRAVEIAKDILNKLKLAIGDKQTIDGLKLKPTEDTATLGAITKVAALYERLLAWARGANDLAIFQHPAVLSATRAIGQLGYLAKAEALRMAQAAGNNDLAKKLGEQLKELSGYAPKPGTRIGQLLESVEQGIDTVMRRTQQVQVSGAQVGQSIEANQGKTMSTPPTAGIANQAGATATQRNQQALLGDIATANAQANALNAQAASQARQQQAQQGQGPQPMTSPRGGATVGRAHVASAKNTLRNSTSGSALNAGAPMNLNQAQSAARNASAAQAAREQEDRARHELEAQQQRLMQEKAASAQRAKAAAAKIDPSLIKGFKSATDLSGTTGPLVTGKKPVDPKSVAAAKAALAELQAKQAAKTQTPPAANAAPENPPPPGSLYDPNYRPPLAPNDRTRRNNQLGI